MLKSILSSTLPYSTTSIDRSLNRTANSEIDFARFYTSAPLCPSAVSSSNSCIKNSSDCLVSALLPWSSWTLVKWSFSMRRNSKVTVFSLSARIVCMLRRTIEELVTIQDLLYSSDFSVVRTFISSLSLSSDCLIKLVIECVLCSMFRCRVSSSSKKLSLILFWCIRLRSWVRVVISCKLYSISSCRST